METKWLEDFVTQPRRLTLCGERSSLSFDVSPRGWARRLAVRFARIDLARELESL